MSCPVWIDKSFPLAFLLLAIGGTVNLGGGTLPETKLVVLLLLYWVFFFVFKQVGAASQFLIGSLGGVSMWGWLGVLAIGVEINYHFYTFLTPIAGGFMNALAYKLEQSARVPGLRWNVVAFGGFATNIAVGVSSGYIAKYHGSQMYVYLATSLSAYIWIAFGPLRWLDQFSEAWEPKELQSESSPSSYKAAALTETDPQKDESVYTLELPTKAFWFKTFNLIFIMAFVVGWSITYYKHPEFIEDNPIRRAFGYNNICIGVDYGPARVAANWLWGIMLLPISMFVVSSYMHMVFNGASKAVVRWNMLLMTVGFVLAMAFGLAFGIQPLMHDVQSVYIHTWGFALGLIGYSMTRLSEVVAFFNQYQRPWPQGGAMYIVLLTVYFFWCVVGTYFLIKSLLNDPLAANLAHPPGHLGNNKPAEVTEVWMWVWTVGILLLPALTNFFVPDDVNKIYISAGARTRMSVERAADLIWSETSTYKWCADKILQLSWVYIPIVVAVFFSPVNQHVPKVIKHVGGWRLFLYAGGVFMGLSYSISGLILAVQRPFSPMPVLVLVKEMLRGRLGLGQALQAYVYFLLLPLGLGLFFGHIYMLYLRMSGCSIGDHVNIGACVCMQAVFLMGWMLWYCRARRFQELATPSQDGPKNSWAEEGPVPFLDEAARRGIDQGLACSLAGTSVILTSWVMRLLFVIFSHGNWSRFDTDYTGSMLSQACAS